MIGTIIIVHIAAVVTTTAHLVLVTSLVLDVVVLIREVVLHAAHLMVIVLVVVAVPVWIDWPVVTHHVV